MTPLLFNVTACGSSESGHEGGDSFGALSVTDGVVDVIAASSAFAALMGDGTVVAWGNKEKGGDASEVKR